MTHWINDHAVLGRVACGGLATVAVLRLHPAPWVMALGICAVWPVGVAACCKVRPRPV